MTARTFIAKTAIFAVAYAPIAHAVTAKNDSARPEDPTKPAIAMIVQGLSTATNTPVVWNTITDEEYSLEPPEAAPKVNSRSV